MLKKVISLLLIPIVVVFSSGFSIFAEHCAMSKNPSYSLSAEQSCCCSKEMHDKCCDQTRFDIKKIDDDYSRTASCTIPQIEFLESVFPVTQTDILSCQTPLSYIYPNDHAPPEPHVSFSILYRSILI